MFKAPLSLKSARVLISNDDGINASGLKRLEAIAGKLFNDVWVVAPETEQSATGHSLTLRNPLRLKNVGNQRFSVSGTPTDCVLLAVNHIMKDCPPDLVLSGINMGSNVGEDMTYSGTIAAAMEATLLGIPAIALSQCIEEEDGGTGRVTWTAADAYVPKVIEKLTSVSWPRDVMMNINIPGVPRKKVTGIEITREGRRKLGDKIVEGMDPRGTPYYWIGAQWTSRDFPKGTDLEAILRGAVSITPLSLDLTHRPIMRKLSKLFE